jgi:transmembrane sensor
VQVQWSEERLERSLARVHLRVGQSAARIKVGMGAVVLAAAAALLWLRPWHEPPAPAPVAAVAPAVSAPSASDPKTTFPDGSVARVSDGGELVLKSATPEHIESVLAAGGADFEVTKRPSREFVVVSGDVRVRVVGTRFRVERVGERTRVSVREGKVEVRQGDELVYLEAGESRFFPGLQAEPLQPEPRSSASASAGAAAGHARFMELARSSQFKAAYQLMSQNPTVVGASAEELMLAADSARLSGHADEALRYLRRVTQEHGSDSRAPISAFTQGRLLLSQLRRPGEAAEAFALARKLRPAGSLAEDALAREAEARAAAGSGGRAKALATDYLARYPKGKHLSTMQRLASTP